MASASLPHVELTGAPEDDLAWMKDDEHSESHEIEGVYLRIAHRSSSASQRLLHDSGRAPVLDQTAEAVYTKMAGRQPRIQLVLGVSLFLAWAGGIVWASVLLDVEYRWVYMAVNVSTLAIGAAVLFYLRREAERQKRLHFAAAVQACTEKLAERHNLEQRIFGLSQKLRTSADEQATMYALLFKGQRRSNCEYAPSGTREFLLAAPEARRVSKAAEGNPDKALPQALGGRKPDWEAAERCARSIRKVNYTLRQFYVDVRQAFPELTLYTVTSEETRQGQTAISSGVTAEEEYRRTLGALFAVYWLARLGMDGEKGFSFGVDDDWMPREQPVDPTSTDDRRRLDFFQKQEWTHLQDLMVDAGIMSRVDDGFEVVVERMVAMLALTAIHDIFKVEALLPRVSDLHAPYQGFQADDTINDHDVAMYYVLDHFPHTLPSFYALPHAQQNSIRFTQSKMGFNHGWLVQAEAPPNALFSRFKETIDQGGAAPADVAFYFIHWLTDLAGAVPSPLDGSEKFVLKFPHAVLASFIKSFGVLEELAQKTETEVFESYLERAWQESAAGYALGPLPNGDEAIALMRLTVQAQNGDKQQAIVEAFSRLDADDRRVLTEEMARTGVENQTYKRAPPLRPGGPAILVYYSPAFVRGLTPHAATHVLRLLAEVYRRARKLWPLTPMAPGKGHTVTVRIDQIKELSLEEIQSVYTEGQSWLLYKRNELEAVVECHPLDFMTELVSNGHKCVVLKFWRRLAAGSGRSSSTKTTPRNFGQGSLSAPPRPFSTRALLMEALAAEKRAQAMSRIADPEIRAVLTEAAASIAADAESGLLMTEEEHSALPSWLSGLITQPDEQAAESLPPPRSKQPTRNGVPGHRLDC